MRLSIQNTFVVVVAVAHNMDVADIDVEEVVLEKPELLLSQQVVGMLVDHNILDIENSHNYYKLMYLDEQHLSEQHLVVHLFQEAEDQWCQRYIVGNIGDNMLVVQVFDIDSMQRIVDQLKHQNQKQQQYIGDIAAIVGAVAVVAVDDVAVEYQSTYTKFISSCKSTFIKRSIDNLPWWIDCLFILWVGHFKLI